MKPKISTLDSDGYGGFAPRMRARCPRSRKVFVNCPVSLRGRVEPWGACPRPRKVFGDFPGSPRTPVRRSIMARPGDRTDSV
ncbi:MAG: hypothetical protein H0V75_01580 [Rubrobacter sp.]|nr:hypothetical protein [Rubrobacter sp.]